MAAFEYLALDGSGRTQRGVLNGDSARQVRSLLRGRGLHPVNVHTIVEDTSARSGLASRRRVSAAALALLTRQLATLVRAGVPLEEALRVLGAQAATRRLQSVLAGLRARITEGASLHEAMAGFPNVFPELYRSMVEAGAAGGRLDEVLERLADHAEARRELRQAISTALIYPLILTMVALLLVIALLTYVVPEVVKVFEQTGEALPLLTLWLIGASRWLRDYGLLLGAGSGAALLLCKHLLGRPRVRAGWHRLLLELPFIGSLNRTLHAARLARTLAILTKSGVPFLEALEISNRMIINIPLHRAVQEAAGLVREGGRLHAALQQHGWFPPLLVHMIAAGEESGELDNMLERAAAHEERELKTAISTATSLVEPVIILVMGAIVLAIVLAILLPIFEMNQLVGV